MGSEDLQKDIASAERSILGTIKSLMDKYSDLRLRDPEIDFILIDRMGEENQFLASVDLNFSV